MYNCQECKKQTQCIVVFVYRSVNVSCNLSTKDRKVNENVQRCGEKNIKLFEENKTMKSNIKKNNACCLMEEV